MAGAIFSGAPNVRAFCCHQAQVGGGADFSGLDETSLVEDRQMLFDRHEVGGSMTGGRIDVIADQNSSSGSEQTVELSVELRDAACVAQLVHGLKRDNEIEAGGYAVGPVCLFKIPLHENSLVFELGQTLPAKVEHLRREVDQRIARDLTIFQQRFGEESRSAAELEDR